MGLKNLFILFILLAGFEAVASINGNPHIKTVEKVAKDLRDDFWQNGHQDVRTSIHNMGKADLDKHFDPTKRYFTYLEAYEMEAIYRCQAQDNCEVYKISLSSNYWGGYGAEAHFITLDTETNAYSSFDHVVFSD